MTKPLFQPNGYKMNDGFCGAGGLTLAAWLAGFAIGSALNHSPLAINTHKINFPHAQHFCADARLQHAGALGFCDWIHLSPDCRHHSRAKGGKPVSVSVRALPVEVPRYAWAANAKVITIENVPEFVEWGPEEQVLGEDGQPLFVLNEATGEQEPVMRAIASRKGEYYSAWKSTLHAMGYINQESWFLNSANYGSAQARRRYFGVFTRVGIPIPKEPVKTHDEFGRGGLPKWRGAIEILEPGNYGKSVFRASYVENTLNRMAEVVERYGETAAPWLMKYNSNPPSGKPNPGFSSWKPLHTLTCQRTPLVIRPVLLHPYYKSGKCIPLLRPLQTLTCKDRFSVMSAVLPLPTLMTKSKFSVLSAKVPVPGFTFSHQFTNSPRSVQEPLRTMLASRRHQYVGFFHYWGQKGQQSPLDRPLPTIVTNGHTRLLSGLYAPGEAGEKVIDHPNDTAAMRRLKAACRRCGIVDLLARMLTVRESARGQGFPDWYQFLGSETEVRKMIGNAVEVNMGLAVAREVQQMLDRFISIGRKLPKLRKSEMMTWEQGELFSKEVAA